MPNKSKAPARLFEGGKLPDISLRVQDAFELLKSLPSRCADLVVSSPPYHVGKEYDVSTSAKDFFDIHMRLAPELNRVLRPGGSLCWQVGHHAKDGVIVPLDALVYPAFSTQKELRLRNRIVWTFGHGVHATKRFSGRHETVLWFTKGDNYRFDLDAVRVPQKYPGKRHYKGPKKGDFSGNPLGKNPGDVWDIPNVKSRHVEKTAHPCQFPVALVQRLILALTRKGDLVVDPFMGSGTSALAAALEGRRFAGCDIERRYVTIARKRISDLQGGKHTHRPIEKPVHVPSAQDSVAKRPAHFRS